MSQEKVKSQTEIELDEAKKKLLESIIRSEIRKKVKEDVTEKPDIAGQALKRWFDNDKDKQPKLKLKTQNSKL